MRKLICSTGIALLSMGACFAGASAYAQDISFAEIMAAPNDLTLNLAYAEQQMDDGDYLRAAATLERLLLLKPGWDEARLLYAVSLLRIGDMVGAEGQLEILEASDLPERLIAPVRDFSIRAAAQKKPSRLLGVLYAGAGYDSNAGTLIIEDYDALLFEEQDENSFIYGGLLRFEHDLGDLTDTVAYAQTVFSGKEFGGDLLDGYFTASSRVGISREKGGHVLDGNIRARQFWVAGELYLNELGAGLSYTRALDPKTSLTLEVSVHDQEYEEIYGNFASLEEQRSGMRWDARAMLSRQFGSSAQGSIGVEYRDKSADYDEFAYQLTGLQGALDLSPNNTIYVDIDALYRQYDFELGSCEDDLTYLRGALGVRLAALLPDSAVSNLKRLGAEFGVYHSDRQSTINAYDFDNTGAEVRLVYRFGY